MLKTNSLTNSITRPPCPSQPAPPPRHRLAPTSGCLLAQLYLHADRRRDSISSALDELVASKLIGTSRLGQSSPRQAAKAVRAPEDLAIGQRYKSNARPIQLGHLNFAAANKGKNNQQQQVAEQRSFATALLDQDLR